MDFIKKENKENINKDIIINSDKNKKFFIFRKLSWNQEIELLNNLLK